MSFESDDDTQGQALSRESKQWAMFIHLSQYCGFVVPFAGLIVPIVLWQMKKDELPGVDDHGKVVVNWIISQIIYGVVSAILCLLIIGIPLLIALLIMGLIFPLIGGLKANNGDLWSYPMSLTLLK